MIKKSQDGQAKFNMLQRNHCHRNLCFDPYGKIEQILTKYESPIVIEQPKTELDISFTLKNQQGEIIFFLTDAEKSKHEWFFDQSSCFQGLTLGNPLCTLDLETLANLSPYWSEVTEFKK